MRDVLIASAREAKRPLILAAILVVLGTLAIAAVIAVGFLGAIYLYKPTQPPTSLDDERIPRAAVAYGAIQVIDCARMGETCEQFEDAKEYLRSSSRGQGITYTPLEKDGRVGAPTTIAIDDSTTDQEFREFGRNITGNGLISASAGPHESDFKGKGNDLTFRTNHPRHPLRGSITLRQENGTLLLESLTYQEAP